MKNEVAIVILNWNGKKFLQDFLPSVIEHSGDARIIVADNASDDESVAFLKSNFDSIEIIQNDQNGGFAKGYNDALKHVNSKYYLLLNSDIEVTEGWLEPLLEQMKDETIAGCQPKIMSYHERTRFEHAGAVGGYIDRNYFPFCRGRILNETEIDTKQYEGVKEIFWATGACMLIRSELFHKVGGFDEDFFAHMEEIDLCWRLKKMNYRFVVCPQSVIYHFGGGTLPYSSPRKTYLNFRNSLYMITKNHEGLLFPKLFWRMSIDGVAALVFIAKGEFKQFIAVIKSHMSFYRKLRTFLKKRKSVQAQSTTFNPTGIFYGNILWNRYIKGVKEYSRLNQRLFK